MGVNWSALGGVFVTTVAAVVVVTGLVAVGVRGLAAREVTRENGGTGAAALTSAVVCFAVCAAVVGYGIYLIVAK